MNELAKFLVEAKKNTYASVGESGEIILEDGSKELVYEENDLKYKDRYFGFNPFIGEEVVQKDGKTIWGMNYYGKILRKTISEKQVYNFLKEALSRVDKENPFRGPDNYKKEGFEYRNKVKGNIKNFKGVEIILYKGEEVYKLEYHGGMLNE